MNMDISPGMLATRDTDLAAALLTKGASLHSWHRNPGTKTVQWCIEGVRQEWVREFTAGTDGFQTLLANRRNLVRIATEFPQESGFRAGRRAV